MKENAYDLCLMAGNSHIIDGAFPAICGNNYEEYCKQE